MSPVTGLGYQLINGTTAPKTVPHDSIPHLREGVYWGVVKNTSRVKFSIMQRLHHELSTQDTSK